MTVPQCDPGAAYRQDREAVDAAIGRVLRSGRYILGPEVAAFEQAFARFCGVAHAAGVGSGTDALALALRALGIGPGDAVITVSHTAVATVAAIRSVGAMPVLVDVREEDFNMDPGEVRAVLEGPAGLPRGWRYRALLPVHLYGRMADMAALMSIAREFDLRVVEDCSQAHGAEFAGRRAGGFGDAATFSFYPTKNLGAFGDGGAVVTGDAATDRRVRLLREYGWRERYVSELEGTNSRLDELQAAVLGARLPSLERENEARRAVAGAYLDGLAGTAVVLPRLPTDGRHVFHQFAVRTPARDRFRGHLDALGVKTLVHYPVPVHQQPAYAGSAVVRPRPLPRTEAIGREVVSLPMFPQMEPAQVDAVIAAVRSWHPA